MSFPKFDPASLVPPPVVPFDNKVLTLHDGVDEEIRKYLDESLQALNPPGLLEKMLFGDECVLPE